MQNLFATVVLTGGGGESVYIPVPCRGIVKKMVLACNANMVATGTVVAYRGATAVNTATVPTGDTAIGATLTGTPDTTYKDYVFDPDSTTVANKVIKVTDDATLLAGAGTLSVYIQYDDSAAIAQAASEA